MKRPRIEINLGEVDELLERAKQAPLSESDCNKIKTLLHTLAKLLVSRRTEKTRAVVDNAGGEAAAGEPAASTEKEKEEKEKEKEKEKKKPKGHGRNPASEYTGATKVDVPHPTLHPGDACPECPKGKVYVNQEPRPLVRVVGQAPLGATVYALEQLRCNACGYLYTAPEPAGVGPEKYDATAIAMIAELKYGSGVPFHRIENLEKRLGVPLPATTQWELVEEASVQLQPVRNELIRQAAHVGDLFMSLIHTCQLNGVNSFDYLVALMRHAAEVAASPREWMPWCYRAALGTG